MTVRNVKKNLAGQQDLLPGVGPYNQVRRGVAVSMDGPAKSYIELWKSYCGDAYVGTFEDGFTATTGSVAVSLTLGRAYRYIGATQVTVAEDSSPGLNWSELVVSTDSLMVRETLRRSYAEAGYNLVAGSFKAGGIVYAATDAVLYEAEGKAYSWGGVLPKIVPENSSPELSGGIRPGAWRPITDLLLRDDLSTPDGAQMIGAAVGKTQADVNSELYSAVQAASSAGLVADFGYWSLSASNTTPASGEVSFNTGYVATSNTAVFHQTDKQSRDMEQIIGLVEVGSAITFIGKLSSAKRTVVEVTSMTVTSTTATVGYTIVSHSGTNVAAGEEYKVILPIPAGTVGYTKKSPVNGKTYVQKDGLWTEIQPYELGRAMFTITGTSYKFQKNADNSMSVAWSQVRLFNKNAGALSVADVSSLSIPVGSVAYIDTSEVSPYPVHTGLINDTVPDATLGKKIILIGNYTNGYAFGELGYQLARSADLRQSRRVVSGAIKNAVATGANYVISTGVGRSYIEKNSGASEYDIAPVTDITLTPGQALTVDFVNGSLNGSNQFIPVVESVASNGAGGWMSEDKYILVGSSGKDGALFGAYRLLPQSDAGVDTSVYIQQVNSTSINIVMKCGNNTSDKYVRYHMQRTSNTATRSDVWRINSVHEVSKVSDLGFVTGTMICSTGEFECALRETGKSDYMGGWRHGDDELVSVTFLADGNVVDPSVVQNYKCGRFEVIQKSELLEVDNPTRNVRAIAYRRWVYTKGEFELFHHVEFAQNFNVEIAFFNMFPIKRLGSDGVTMITNKAYRSPRYDTEDISTIGFPITFNKAKIIRYSGPSGFSAEVEVLEGWDKPGRNTWIQNAEEYNKGYFDYTGTNYNAIAGESLTSRAVYRIFDSN